MGGSVRRVQRADHSLENTPENEVSFLSMLGFNWVTVGETRSVVGLSGGVI